MKVTVRPCSMRGILDDVLEQEHRIGTGEQRCEPEIDLRLTRGCDLMMLRFHVETDGHEILRHLVAQVLEVIRRRDREVAFLVARLVREVRHLFPARVPCGLRWSPRGSTMQCSFVSKRTSSKMKNSASAPKYAVSAMPVDFRNASAFWAMFRGQRSYFSFVRGS